MKENNRIRYTDENKDSRRLLSKALLATLVFAAFMLMPLAASANGPYPSIYVDKMVQDPETGAWGDEATAYVGDTVTFMIEVTDNGPFRLEDICVYDRLSGSMEYADNAWLQIPGSTGWISITPSSSTTTPSGETYNVWLLPYDLVLYPSDVIFILFDVKVVEAGEGYNKAEVCGDSLVQPYATVCDGAIVTIHALPVPQPSLCPNKYRWSAYYTPGYEWDPFPDLFRSWTDVHFVNYGVGDAYNVVASISYAPANVNIVDGDVTLGDIPADGGGAWSSDFFELEVDMNNPQDPNEGITWTVEYDDAAGNHYVIENVPQFCAPG